MSQNPLDEWTPPFDREWNQKEAAAYLTDNRNGPVFDPYGPLTSRITEAVLAGKLVADKREVPYKPSAFDTVFKIRYGRMDPKDLPATETEYRIKPIDAICWALDAGINVRPACLAWYESITDEPLPAGTPNLPTTGRNHPPYLKPADLAKAFNGMHGWNVGAWMKYLGDPADWMKTARIETPGKGRTNPNLWNPLELAKCLMHRDPKTDLKELDRRFKTRPELSTWRGEWETGPGAHLD